MDEAAARLWQRATVQFVGWFAFGYVTIQLLRRLGIEPMAALLLAYLLGLGLVGIALHLAWRAGGSPAVRWSATMVVLVYVTWVVGLKPLMWTLIVIRRRSWRCLRRIAPSSTCLPRPAAPISRCPRPPCSSTGRCDFC